MTGWLVFALFCVGLAVHFVLVVLPTARRLNADRKSPDLCWICGALLVSLRREWWCVSCRARRRRFWFERLPPAPHKPSAQGRVTLFVHRYLRRRE